MTNALIGKKLGMSTVFDDDGLAIPVTLLEMGPCTVVQVKKASGPDGYNSIQLGYEPVKLRKLTKPMQGHFEKKGIKDGFRVLQEFPVQNPEEFEPGRQITAEEIFQENTTVKVRGTSKGAGFAGGVKRHGFRGAPATHGASKVHRKPMSGGATDAARVFKGKRGPGHMGNARVTVKNLQIVKIKALDAAPAPEQQKPVDQADQAAQQDQKKDAKATGASRFIVAVKGAVPGKKNSLVIVEKL